MRPTLAADEYEADDRHEPLMPSISLQTWRNERRLALDELKAAHQSVGGTGRGRRYATQQINHAYAVLLSSQFQGFCRDLHEECTDYFLQSVPVKLQPPIRLLLIGNRKLVKGNANPGNIGEDFNRFGLSFWTELKNLDARNERRRERLEELNQWRNAIAHHDFDPIVLGTAALRLQLVERWRNVCHRLAGSFDEVMRIRLLKINGTSPW